MCAAILWPYEDITACSYFVTTPKAQKEESALYTPPKSLLSPFRMFVLAFFNLKGQRATRAKHHHATTAVAQPIHGELLDKVIKTELLPNYIMVWVNTRF